MGLRANFENCSSNFDGLSAFGSIRRCGGGKYQRKSGLYIQYLEMVIVIMKQRSLPDRTVGEGWLSMLFYFQ